MLLPLLLNLSEESPAPEIPSTKVGGDDGFERRIIVYEKLIKRINPDIELKEDIKKLYRNIINPKTIKEELQVVPKDGTNEDDDLEAILLSMY